MRIKNHEISYDKETDQTLHAIGENYGALSGRQNNMSGDGPQVDEEVRDDGMKPLNLRKPSNASNDSSANRHEESKSR